MKYMWLQRTLKFAERFCFSLRSYAHSAVDIEMIQATGSSSIFCCPPSITQPATPPCTFPGYGVRVRAGADHRAGGMAEGAGEKGINDFSE